MNATRRPETPSDVMRRLEADGWVRRSGKGDHVNFSKPGVREIVTIDTGRREVAFGILRRIYRIAGWRW